MKNNKKESRERKNNNKRKIKIIGDFYNIYVNT